MLLALLRIHLGAYTATFKEVIRVVLANQQNTNHNASPFLANVNSSSGSLYVVVRPSVVCLSVCRL